MFFHTQIYYKTFVRCFKDPCYILINQKPVRMQGMRSLCKKENKRAYLC